MIVVITNQIHSSAQSRVQQKSGPALNGQDRRQQATGGDEGSLLSSVERAAVCWFVDSGSPPVTDNFLPSKTPPELADRT